MGKVRAPIDPVADLRRRLARASPRGAPLARIRACVRRWWRDHGLDSHPATVGKRIANVLIEQRSSEQKVAGVLVLEQLADQLRTTDIPAFARLFTGGHLTAWPVVHHFADRVLAALLERESNQADTARSIASWRTADNPYQRTAACIALTSVAARIDTTIPALASMILNVCATVVWSPERSDQLAVGQLLRQLARAEPDRVETFFVRHARFMSRECARAAVASLTPEKRRELLAYHTRATTLRR
jgi:hypothetical protein